MPSFSPSVTQETSSQTEHLHGNELYKTGIIHKCWLFLTDAGTSLTGVLQQKGC